jgi:hypothetical protein
MEQDREEFALWSEGIVKKFSGSTVYKEGPLSDFPRLNVY